MERTVASNYVSVALLTTAAVLSARQRRPPADENTTLIRPSVKIKFLAAANVCRLDALTLNKCILLIRNKRLVKSGGQAP